MRRKIIFFIALIGLALFGLNKVVATDTQSVHFEVLFKNATGQISESNIGNWPVSINATPGVVLPSNTPTPTVAPTTTAEPTATPNNSPLATPPVVVSTSTPTPEPTFIPRPVPKVITSTNPASNSNPTQSPNTSPSTSASPSNNPNPSSSPTPTSSPYPSSLESPKASYSPVPGFITTEDSPTPTPDELKNSPKPSPSSQSSKSWAYYLLMVVAFIALVFFIRYLWLRRNTPQIYSSDSNIYNYKKLVTTLTIVLAISGVILISNKVKNQSSKADDVAVKPDIGKYVLWMGWTMPTLDQLETQTKWSNNNIFDGIILQRSEIFSGNKTFHLNTFQPGAVLSAPDFEPLAERWVALVNKTGQLKHSLVRTDINGAYATFNWNQPDSILDGFYHNWEVLSKWAINAQLDGIFMDTERYSPRDANPDVMFDIPRIYHNPTTGEDIDLTALSVTDPVFISARKAVSDRIYAFGKHLGEITTQAAAGRDFHIMLSYSTASLFSYVTQSDWKSTDYELIPDFYDGLLAGSGANIHYHDGNESTYPTKATSTTTSLAQFGAVKNAALSDKVAAVSRDQAAYKTRTNVGYGLWLDARQQTPWYFQDPDMPWQKTYLKKQTDGTYKWSTEPAEEGATAENNYFSPSVWQDSLRGALLSSDRYVWIYSQRPDVWNMIDKYSTLSNGYTISPLSSDYISSMQNLRNWTAHTAPTCTPPIDQTLMAGHDFSTTAYPTFSSATNTTVLASLQKGPSNLSWNSTNKNIVWKPSSDQVGDQNLTWQVSDGLTTGTCSTTLHVTDSTPKISATLTQGDTELTPGKPATFVIHLRNDGNDVAIEGHLQFYLPSGWKVTSPSNSILVGDHFEFPLEPLAVGATSDLTITASSDAVISEVQVIPSNLFTTLQDAITAIGQNKAILDLVQPLSIQPSSQSVTIPENITLRFEPSGHLKFLDTTTNLIINSDLTLNANTWAFEIPTFSNPKVVPDLIHTSKSLESISPKWWGAKGNGNTNDTIAFNYATQYLQDQGGGKLFIPLGTYIVGKQTPVAGDTLKNYAYSPYQIISFQGLTNPVVVEGEIDANGMRPILKAADGLHFGSFDPVTGQKVNPCATTPAVFHPYQAASAYLGMVYFKNNTDVTVKNLELDGNSDNLILGGCYGDTGIQLGATGVYDQNNTVGLIENVYTHHHGLDGVLVDDQKVTLVDYDHVPKITKLQTLNNVKSEYNGRQGMSWTGGIGLHATNSEFNFTGKGRISSNPRAGVDLEPYIHGQIVRDGIFENCKFLNNAGFGLISDNGDVANVRVDNSLIWGHSGYALWPQQPGFSFNGDTIYGLSVHPWNAAVPANGSSADPDGTKHTKFNNSHFEDLPFPGDSSKQLGGWVLSFDGVYGTEITNSSITTHTHKAFWIAGASSADKYGYAKIDNLIVNMGNPVTNLDFQGLLNYTNLKNISFNESGNLLTSTNKSYIWVHNSSAENIKLTGPTTYWNSLTATFPIQIVGPTEYK